MCWRERTGSSNDFGLRISNFGLGEIMERVWIDRLDVNLKSTLRNLKSTILLCAMFFALSITADAQQAKKMARIGYLSPQSGPLRTPTLEAFKEGLAKLGWVEGKQIEFEYRYAAGDLGKLSEFA